MGALIAVLAVLLLCPSSAGAQDTARNVNPEAIEFDGPLLAQPGVSQFRVDLFRLGADPQRDTPIKSMQVGRGLTDRRSLRVEIRNFVLDVPDGQYIVAVRALSGEPPVASEPTAPSDPFVLSRPGDLDVRLADDRRERFWTRVGLAIAGAAVLIPALF